MEAMKDQMTSMMETMLSMKQMMENNAATIPATNAAAEVNSTHPSAIKQTSQPVPDMVGQGGEVLGSTSSPYMGQNRNSFPYGLPPNYTPPDAVHVPNDNANHFIPVPLERQQPQLGHAPFAQPVGDGREEPRDHALGDFEPYPTYTTEGPAFSGMPQPNAMGAPQHRPLQPLHFSVGRLPPAMEEREKLDLLEERLRAIEGISENSFANMAELCLLPDIVIPPKFKVSDFNKYKGTTYPKNHLKMYCRKMGAYSRDEKLLMHFFQESLAGATVTWYTNLEASRISSWKDFMDTFIRQYQYNIAMAFDRTQLQNMSKKEHESFKEFTKRWRDLAAQVAPPMMEKEMITMIVDTLPVFYYDKMVGYMPSSFTNLVFEGERIEVGLRRGKFDYAASTSTNNRRFRASGAKKNEGDTHAVTLAPT